MSAGSWGGVAGSRDTSDAGEIAKQVPGDRERLRTDGRDWLEAGNPDARLKFPPRWSDAKAEGINSLLSTRLSLRLSGFHSLGAKWLWPWS